MSNPASYKVTYILRYNDEQDGRKAPRYKEMYQTKYFSNWIEAEEYVEDYLLPEHDNEVEQHHSIKIYQMIAKLSKDYDLEEVA